MNAPLSSGNVAHFSRKRKWPTETGLAGWGGRIRTSAWRNQNPLPYHLATPQCALGLPLIAARRRPQHSGAVRADQYWGRSPSYQYGYPAYNYNVQRGAI